MHTQSRWPLSAERQPHRRTRSQLRPGDLVGRYVVESYAGRGGFASVYRALDSLTAEVVALKVLHRDLVRSTRSVRRFEREIEALRRLRHPNIVDVTDHGALADGRPYYVMSWIAGESIDRSLLRRGAFSLPEAIEILGEVAAALEVAHREGVVHRDVKPSNVMLLEGGHRLSVRLLDFGLAKYVHGETAGDPVLTGDMIVGSPSYMAPEQFSGDAISPRTDVYALGVMLFEMVTGQVPFDAPNVVGVQTQHVCAPPPAASEWAPVPPEVDDVIRKAMAKNPGDRFATVGGMVAALAAVSRRPSRAPSPVAPRVRTLGFGLHVAAILETDDPDDLDFADLDALLDEAHRRCREAGLVIAHEGGDAFLALAIDDRDTAAERILELALELSFLGSETVGVSITVNRSSVERAGGEVVGGPLLELARWVGPGRPGIWAAPALALG